MAERKSGPVKPPVIDLTARPAEAPPMAGSARASVPPGKAPADTTAPDAGKGDSAAPAAATAPIGPTPTGTSQKASPLPPSAPGRHGPDWTVAALGGIGGAVVAITVCYGLAAAGLWPANGTGLAAVDSRVTAAEHATSEANAGLAALNGHFGTLQTDVTARLGAASTALTAAQARLGKLEAGGNGSGAIGAEAKTLTARLDAVATGASSADAGALAANLSTVQQGLAALTQKVSTLDDRAGAADNAIAALRTDLGTAKAAIDKAAAAPSPKTIATAMQLPLLISALDADFAAGRPFADDLKSLAGAMPEAQIPASLSGAAASGLPAAADVVAAFEGRMPDIMAARPASTDDGWQTKAGDWLKGVLALRQQGVEAGDGADAVLSRLEAAVNRHDFAGALTLLGQLPPPMQQAMGDVRGQLQSLADAETFLADLRRKALAPASGVEQ